LPMPSLPSRLLSSRMLPARWLARMLPWMFNLNDGKWGRGDNASPPPAGNTGNDGNNNGNSPAPNPPPPPAPSGGQGGGSGGQGGQGGGSGGPGGPNQGPPDLDELWRDFNRKLGGLFGGNKQPPRGGNQPDWNRHNSGGGGGGGFQPPTMKSAGIGVGLISAIVVLIWLGTGFFIVQEGQQAVITRFGALSRTVEAGFNWRLPYPFERHETVALTQLRSVEIGRNSAVGSSGLKDWSMLTQDENIVDVRFTIQYRLKNAADYLFQNNRPDEAVVKAAESAIREVVGKGSMDTVLNKDRESIQREVSKSVQAQLDRYKTGIEVQNVNITNVQPPEAVQAAFDDALKAGQDRDRAKNDGQAYANDVIPRARGTASRLKEEAEGYKARVVAQAEGDSQRFRSVYTEYAKAPQVTRDRMYLDAMQQIYSSTTKILVDSRQGNNLLYLPLDKIIQQTAASNENAAMPGANTAPNATNSVANTPPPAATTGRESNRSGRERDTR
jgi:modulator of FtsH protease HflK